LSLLLFKGGGFLSSERPVLDPFEQTGKIYMQKGKNKQKEKEQAKQPTYQCSNTNIKHQHPNTNPVPLSVPRLNHQLGLVSSTWFRLTSHVPHSHPPRRPAPYGACPPAGGGVAPTPFLADA
jgi:hypothetical protein